MRRRDIACAQCIGSDLRLRHDSRENASSYDEDTHEDVEGHEIASLIEESDQ